MKIKRSHSTPFENDSEKNTQLTKKLLSQYKNLKKENQSSYNPFTNNKLKSIKSTEKQLALAKLKDLKLAESQILDVSAILDVKLYAGKIEIVKSKEKGKITMKNNPFENRMFRSTTFINNKNQNRQFERIQNVRRIYTSQQSRVKLRKQKSESCQNFRIRSPQKISKCGGPIMFNFPQFFIQRTKTPNPQNFKNSKKNISIKCI